MGMAVTTGGRRKQALPEMNVTPLVDVVLVLLIIFMVMTPLMAKQFWLSLPTKPKLEAVPVPEETEAPKRVVVTVTQQGQIRINKDVVADADFAKRLTRVLAAQGDRTIFFDAHNKAAFGRASQALDMARGAGATTIAVAVDSITKD